MNAIDIARNEARRYYTDGLTVPEIAKRVNRSERSVRHWRQKFGWKKNLSAEGGLEDAIKLLTAKKNKTEKDRLDLDRYCRNLATLRRGDGKRADRVDQERKSNDGGAGKDSFLFAYQRKFLEDKSLLRIVKKSRQTGYTFLIAYEGLTDALKRGRDKSYISASFRQTRIINRYVKQIGRAMYGMKLRGSEVIRLTNGAEINFFAANEATAQGASGDVYFDEYAWLRRAKEMYENAGAIATLKDYRITITSTPSVRSHHFEEIWNNGGPSWSRHLVSVIDAIEGGNNLISLEKIMMMFSARAIRRLFMCETLDDEGAVFTFDQIMACVVDVEEGTGIFAHNEQDTIWGGLDIARDRDDTSTIFLKVEQKNDKEFFTWRQRHLMNRVPLSAQEAKIKRLLVEWKPDEFTIDQTTIGEQLAEAISEEMPAATLARFTPRLKAQLVLNMQDIMAARRAQIPQDDRLIQSFLAIKRKALETDVGYEATRGEGIGHADDFWAMALACYPAWGGGTEGSLIIN